MNDVKRYEERDIMALDEAGGFYYRHIDAMTGESLRSKSDIAAELGYRDMQIEALQAENEMLKVLLARHNDGVLRLIGLSDKRERVRVGENMREETSEMMQPVINKLKADAVREFANSTVLSGRVMEEAIIYATKLEAGE